MKIFNLENAPKGRSASKTECIVIGTWDEWSEILKAIDDRVTANPKLKNLKRIKDEFDAHLAVF